MKNILLGFCLIIISSCAAQKNDSAKKYEAFFINDFKKVYFKSCLKYGYNNNTEINNILKEDKSVAGDFALGIENYRFIDSLAKVTSNEIRQDSINHPWKKTPNSSGKRVFKFCLDRYNSKWLDSLAKVRLKK